MSIQSRIDDAKLLWEHEHLEGAFLSVLIAVAATARKRYPSRRVRDREAFERFVSEEMFCQLSVEYLGECHLIEHVFYKWMRCELVHNGAMPTDIEFMPEEGLSVRAGGEPEYLLKVSRGWFEYLVNMVLSVSENQ